MSMSALDVCSVCVYICMYVIDNCVYLRLSQRWADQQRDHQKKEKYPPTPSRIEKSLSKPRIPYQIQSKTFYASLDSNPHQSLLLSGPRAKIIFLELHYKFQT